MNQTPRYVRGQDADRDAWLTNFFTENHLAYETFPDVVASPEQLKFIVHLEGEQIYYPCSDELFSAIIEKRADTVLTSAYISIWTRLEKLVREVITDPYKQHYLLSLLTIKYNHEIVHKVQLPAYSRTPRVDAARQMVEDLSHKFISAQNAVDFAIDPNYGEPIMTHKAGGWSIRYKRAAR